MEKYSKFKSSILLLTFKVTVLSIPVTCWALAGKQAENGPQTSSQLTVRHVLDMQRPPFINLTPSRPTIVQFPAEVSNCVIKSNLISLTYGNGEGAAQSSSSASSDNKSQSGSSSQSSGANAIYSSVTLSVQAVENFTYEDFINTPETYMICSIRSNKSDNFCQGYSDSQNTYCYVTIGIKVENPEHYNAIVYLDKPGSTSALAPIPSKSEVVLHQNRIENDSISHPFENQNAGKPVIVKRLKPEESIPSFKITPFPKGQFKEDRILGLQADSAIRK